ncbi:family 20 glycosylhydrolase [Carboxylicivirga sediminis]|uniref:beta-N-acetylhexosaminidase n=1 Tax=Carboxylicivirga sediminis TaxID=2006564 RepID=A0A941F4D0_9BACT|nr:family 20 glycosylhydrolase [Carboxylicivirga sediminis]MBR8536212.1 family 20 glycosylhydrolase [Carboxylicivirga sediminis]
MRIAILILFTLILTALPGCRMASEDVIQPVNIIPQPNSITYEEGEFQINAQTRLVYKGLDKIITRSIIRFKNQLAVSSGIELELSDQTPTDNYILFQLSKQLNDNTEGYEIKIEPNYIHINASSDKGLFYAIQTVKQLLPPSIESKLITDNVNWTIPCLHIIDYPQFAYRGLNIDVARHYFPVEFIKKQLDILASYKINTFHWHLTDDQGWRLEIKKYPKLTDVGSRRAMTLIGHGANPPFQYDNKPYGGYYTQDDVKAIVEYAKERHITVIPEIELPGHSLAALAAYPQLGCIGGPYEVATRWGVFEDVICPGKESSYAIIEDILTEVADLFPGQYIHIGGDECSKIRWRNCKHCQARMKANELKDENALENYFIKRVQSIVKKLGKQMVGWNEIMTDPSLTDATIVMWQDDIDIKQAIKNNNNFIKSSANYLYFDHYQASPQDHPLAIGGYTPLSDVYHYQPLPAGIDSNEQQNFIGVQANCWTEYMPDEEKFEFMLYPRLCAFAEVAWSEQQQKNWPEFRRKLETHLERLSHRNVNFFYEVPKPISSNEQLHFTHPTTLRLQEISDNYTIRYTTDGSEPNANSKEYTQAIPVNSSGTIKAITIDKRTGQQSKTEIFNLNQLQYQKPTKLKASNNGLSCAVYKGRFKTVKEIRNTNIDNQLIVTDSFIPDSVYRESFGLILKGYFESSEKGIYEFELHSDDGSALYIGKELVVNNDGIHGSKAEKGAIALKKGLYPITILYFQTTGYSQCRLNVKWPDNTIQALKPKDFYY